MMIHEGKGIAGPDLTMQAYMGNRGTAPLILNLSTRWSSVVNVTCWLIYPQGKTIRYQLNRRMGGAQNPSGHFGKNLLPMMGIKPDWRAPRLVPIVTELSCILMMIHSV
jgi:hypothetical protein